MLVLSRKVHEAVVVGNKNGVDRLLKVFVLEIKGNCVRLGFEAAADVPIHRWELGEQLHPAGQPAELLEDLELDVAC